MLRRIIKKIKNSSKGFSLMELVIYIGILSVSAGLFVGILNTTIKTQVGESNKNVVSGQLTFALQTIQRLVGESSYINLKPGVATTTLSLVMPKASNSTKIYLQNGMIYMEKGTSTPQSITNSQVKVDSLSFTKFTQYPAKDAVQIDLAMTGTNKVAGKTVTRALRSIVSRASAVTFDSDLLPGADNSYQIGNTSYRWQNANFAGDVTVGGQLNSLGGLCISGDCKTSWSAVTGVTGTGTAGYVAKWTSTGAVGNSVIYDNGTNVGIGTTTPAYKLDVAGTARFTQPVIVGTPTASNEATTKSYVDTAVAGAGGAWTTNASGIYYNGGNVGIGTASPDNLFQVAGYIDFDNSIRSTALGYQAGNVSTGNYNSFIGYQTGFSNTTGYGNTANGYYALNSNTTGNYNTANGSYALYYNTTGSYNTANGAFALQYNTTGRNNTANGMHALHSNTTGSYNTANGMYALFYNTTGSSNTANGMYALYSNTTGSSNTANGDSALSSNTSGGSNTANGYYALHSNTTGGNNTANGDSALNFNTTGYDNTANGYSALEFNTTGSYNTANGMYAGRYISDGYSANQTSNNSVYLGFNTKSLASGDTNEIVIGYNAVGAGSNSVMLGNSSITTTVLNGNVGIGTTAPAYKLDVAGTARFTQPVIVGTPTASNDAATKSYVDSKSSYLYCYTNQNSAANTSQVFVSCTSGGRATGGGCASVNTVPITIDQPAYSSYTEWQCGTGTISSIITATVVCCNIQ